MPWAAACAARADKHSSPSPTSSIESRQLQHTSIAEASARLRLGTRSETAAGGDSDSVPYCDRPGRGMLAVGRRSRLLRAFRRSKSPSLRCKNLRVCLSLRVCRQHTRLSRFAIRSFIERLAIRRDSRLSQLCLPPPPLLRRLCARAARAEPPGYSPAAS